MKTAAKKSIVNDTPLPIEMWPIDRPKPYAKNARTVSARAIDSVASSLKEFGWRQPIVVDAKDVVIAGHKRLLAALKLGMAEVPVHVALGLTVAQAKAYRLMDNRSNQNSDWDMELVQAEMVELQGKIELELTGFEKDEIEQALQKACAMTGLEEDVPGLPVEAVSKLGDRWLLDEHALVCGDATNKKQVELLMSGEKAQLIFTDPPYNVDYEGYTEQELTIQGDKMTPEKFNEFLVASFANYAAIALPSSSIYVCHPSCYQTEFQNAMEAAGFEIRCQIIWAKNTFAWGFSRYKWQHEPMFYGHLPIYYGHMAKRTDPWYGDRSQSTLWEEPKPAASRLHPTMKPIGLVQRALGNSSQHSDLVVDLFGGAGSTLIACELMKRRCRTMELDPRYADVIIMRWQNYTAGKVARLADGRTFDEVKAARLKVKK